MGEPNDTKIDFQALAREAQETTYNPRAKRCFWPFHAWSMWETANETLTQGRRCLRCGKVQRQHLEKTHQHRWVTTETREIVRPGCAIPVGTAHIQKCSECGEVRRRDL